ncbi:hypothetical protein [Rhizobium sp. RU35A]|uniref:hypothetical protein n=1 Tax=Rhizobium sp. RU35A TaxID=1907414 RepID=UPI00122C767D|nr:hypothetical protein [Rhizobium sp. RU35A]
METTSERMMLHCNKNATKSASFAEEDKTTPAIADRSGGPHGTGQERGAAGHARSLKHATVDCAAHSCASAIPEEGQRVIGNCNEDFMTREGDCGSVPKQK